MTTALDARKAIQSALGLSGPAQDGVIGPQTMGLLHTLVNTADASPWPAGVEVEASAESWPFAMHIDGGDLVSDPDIVITCFGGNGDGTNSDPQDDGSTASGVNTNRDAVDGVSVAMDGRQFPSLSAAEHRALDGAPIPRMPFGTLVVITIDGVSYTPAKGIIDLGPGRQASRAGEAHALDVTVAVARQVDPTLSAHAAATGFERRGQFRILGGAQYVRPA